ncbi:MAG: O-antigen ligase family protein [Azospirillaceae bacterium]|nr:O-antigen ligase family protein [Azospirillaceae bacterium]
MNTKLAALRSAILWGSATLVIALLTGAMAVVLPPGAAIVMVALVAAVLLWALPEQPAQKITLLRNLFLIALVAQMSVPAYYAVRVAGLPWLSIRRVLWGTVIILFLLSVAGSKANRRHIASCLRDNRWLLFATIGFFVMLVVSIPTSANPAFSLKSLTDVFLTWIIPFACATLVIRKQEDVILVLRLIVVCIIADGTFGLIEFILHRRFLFDIFPHSMLQQLMADDPLYAYLFLPSIRNGIYRASSVYTVALSFGEFAAMAGPLATYFVMHGRGWADRLFGLVGLLFCLISLYCAGARGGYIGFLAAMSFFALLWTFRFIALHRKSLAGFLLLSLYPLAFAGLVGAVLFWKRLHNLVLGGGETHASNSGRYDQWLLAQPHLMANPITGHGLGMATDVISYYSLGSTLPSVDSYLLTLLVEVGIPGTVAFFGMLAYAIWKGGRIYLSDLDERATVAAPIACSLVAFAVYRLVLSQRENHTLCFILIGVFIAVANLYRSRATQRGTVGATPGRIGTGATVSKAGWRRPIIPGTVPGGYPTA